MTARAREPGEAENPSIMHPANPGVLPCGYHGDTPEMWICGSCLATLQARLAEVEAERDTQSRFFESAARELEASEQEIAQLKAELERAYVAYQDATQTRPEKV